MRESNQTNNVALSLLTIYYSDKFELLSNELIENAKLIGSDCKVDIKISYEDSEE